MNDGPFAADWTRRPPKDQAQRMWRIARCPTKGSLRVVILSHDLIGRQTHYYAGRTRPCTGPVCQACAKNQAPRWHGYIAAVDLANNNRLVVEVTAGVAERIGNEFEIYRTLRGLRMEMTRTSPRANGRIMSRFQSPATGTGVLPDAPDLRPILERLWEMHSLGNLDAEQQEIRAAAEDQLRQA
jgi:hypothetical protein